MTGRPLPPEANFLARGAAFPTTDANTTPGVRSGSESEASSSLSRAQKRFPEREREAEGQRRKEQEPGPSSRPLAPTRERDKGVGRELAGDGDGGIKVARRERGKMREREGGETFQSCHYLESSKNIFIFYA